MDSLLIDEVLQQALEDSPLPIVTLSAAAPPYLGAHVAATAPPPSPYLEMAIPVGEEAQGK